MDRELQMEWRTLEEGEPSRRCARDSVGSLTSNPSGSRAGVASPRRTLLWSLLRGTRTVPRRTELPRSQHDFLHVGFGGCSITGSSQIMRCPSESHAT